MADNKPNQLLLFDVDGTLAPSTLIMSYKMKCLLKKLKNKGYKLSIVGGGSYEKIVSQIQDTSIFDYIFSENGLVSYYKGELFHKKSLDDV